MKSSGQTVIANVTLMRISILINELRLDNPIQEDIDQTSSRKLFMNMNCVWGVTKDPGLTQPIQRNNICPTTFSS